MQSLDAFYAKRRNAAQKFALRAQDKRVPRPVSRHIGMTFLLCLEDHPGGRQYT